jgi:ABC-type xylose transport system permease subunit
MFYRLAVLAFLFVFALVNIVSLSNWHGIAWLIVCVLVGVGILFTFVAEPTFAVRREPHNP